MGLEVRNNRRQPGRASIVTANRLRDGASTFDLHRGGAAFLEESCRVAHGLLYGNLICQKRHISDDQRTSRRENCSGVSVFCSSCKRSSLPSSVWNAAARISE